MALSRLAVTAEEQAYFRAVAQVMWPKAIGCAPEALQPALDSITQADAATDTVEHLDMLMDFLAATPQWRPDVQK